jgi:hypothetical protein
VEPALRQPRDKAAGSWQWAHREPWWKDAEILMLRHQLAVAERERLKARARLTWPDRAWLALLAGTVPAGSRSIVSIVVGTNWRRRPCSSARRRFVAQLNTAS